MSTIGILPHARRTARVETAPHFKASIVRKTRTDDVLACACFVVGAGIQVQQLKSNLCPGKHQRCNHLRRDSPSSPQETQAQDFITSLLDPEDQTPVKSQRSGMLILKLSLFLERM